MISINDIELARQRIAGEILLTPCAYSEKLSRLTGCELWLKLDNLQKTGSFKDRGGLNKLVSEDPSLKIIHDTEMNQLLVGLSDDPRAGLAPGLYDAGEAILNMELVASLRKPAGFVDPANPAERGADKVEDEDDAKDDEETESE